MMMAKIQKGAATHSANATPMLTTGDTTCTAIIRPALNSNSSASRADSAYMRRRCRRNTGAKARIAKTSKDEEDIHSRNGAKMDNVKTVKMVYRALKSE
jgi:hypothetical protein